ncbi:NADH-quinone oxidoreductase subunit M [Candidatus Saganbacteria bacterium]|nr:NADH-quinone oxidoreductase subunit M [Candidatus Saganbacteria bacterium]
MLSSIIFAPIIGILVLLFTPKDKVNFIKIFATIISLIPFAILGYLALNFNNALHGFQFQEVYQWIPSLGIKYHIGIDGLSLPLLLLTALLTTLSLIYSWIIKDRTKEYFILFLLLEVGMLGVFSSLDLFLFYMFWEISLVPMYFLIGIWGGARREYAAIKFFLYTLIGSLAMLLSILVLYFNSNPHTFDILELARIADPRLAALVFIGFFLAFAIKVPMFPFHTWLPDAHVEAPTAGSVILAGVLLKMGSYGFLRFSLPLLPESCKFFAVPIAILALISIIYGALVAMAQTDLKKLIAYSSVNHMGYVMLGISVAMLGTFDTAAKAAAINGAMLQMVSHGLITGGLFLLVGVIYERTHTRQLADFGGLGAKIPIFAGLFTFFAFGSLGLPGLSGFISEFLIFVGAFPIFPVITAMSLIGVLATAALFLMAIEKMLFGKLLPKNNLLADADGREIFCLSVLGILTLFFGLYPIPLLAVMETTVKALVGGI